VVRHQGVLVQRALAGVEPSLEAPEPEQSIAVIAEETATIVPAKPDVVSGTRNDDALASWHAPHIAPLRARLRG
jgi:hypothetical protein